MIFSSEGGLSKTHFTDPSAGVFVKPYCFPMLQYLEQMLRLLAQVCDQSFSMSMCGKFGSRASYYLYSERTGLHPLPKPCALPSAFPATSVFLLFEPTHLHFGTFTCTNVPSCRCLYMLVSAGFGKCLIYKAYPVYV